MLIAAVFLFSAIFLFVKIQGTFVSRQQTEQERTPIETILDIPAENMESITPNETAPSTLISVSTPTSTNYYAGAFGNR